MLTRQADGNEQPVLERLRLRVPSGTQQAWLEAERDTWIPWLRQKRGFVRREEWWDQQEEVGVIQIQWSSRSAWKAIPQDEVESIQSQFEARAKAALNLPCGSAHPFPLLSCEEMSPP
ncbi:MAG: TIGR03792 family protein [Cyanobacteriota bacterium]|nr:TIGR03792 family protein [Cyanobacteriota bacterium]